MPAIPKEVEACFTSFHIAEEFTDDYKDRALALLSYLKEKEKTIICDISPRGIRELGFSDLEDFAKKVGVGILRCDFGFTTEEMKQAGKHVCIGLNASTANPVELQSLVEQGISVYAIHNFYPRPETGLDLSFFQEQNETLRRFGVKLAAFITGDELLRGPLFQGLPTLEEHRRLLPYVQYARLKYLYGMDLILVGDPGISREQLMLMNRTEQEDVLFLPAVLAEEHQELYERPFTIRPDSPRWIGRLTESRQYATQGPVIQARNTEKRMPGAITIDNENYLRYSGEVQIVKEALPACEAINVIGRIKEEYLGLLPAVTRGRTIQLIP